MAPTGLLVDIDGVLTVSWRALPGVPEAVRQLRTAGVPLRFLTNTTSQTRSAITALLVEAGFDVIEDEILTTTAVTAAHLQRDHPGARCLLLNSGDVTADLAGVEVVDPSGRSVGAVDVVVVGGAGPEFTYELLNRAFQAVVDGAALVAMHRNLTWRTDQGLQLDGGAYVAAVERASGTEATVIGKPAPTMFRLGLESMGVAAQDAAMVGDDLVNDVLAAQAVGVTGVLVRTGKFRLELVDASPDQPDIVLDSFADVPAWLGVV
jgi:HAD superfamily hydrolase (TIGR01458 family)